MSLHELVMRVLSTGAGTAPSTAKRYVHVGLESYAFGDPFAMLLPNTIPSKVRLKEF